MIFVRNLPPAFVKHCQFGSAAIPSPASMIQLLQSSPSPLNGVRAGLRGENGEALSHLLRWGEGQHAAQVSKPADARKFSRRFGLIGPADLEIDDTAGLDTWDATLWRLIWKSAVGSLLCVALLCAGCAISKQAALDRPFVFSRDSLAFSN